jgi:hypothetical protein
MRKLACLFAPILLARDLGTLRAGFTETTAGDWPVCPLWNAHPRSHDIARVNTTYIAAFA